MDVERIVAEARQALEAWRDGQLAHIHAAHDARMQALLAQGRRDLEAGLERALAQYQRGLTAIAEQRRDHQRRSPGIAEQMERVYTRSEESLKSAYEAQVALLKEMYRKGLGIE